MEGSSVPELIRRVKFINFILKHHGEPAQQLLVEPGLSRVTSKIEPVVLDGQIERQKLHFLQLRKGQRVVIVDTPGLSDSDSDDEGQRIGLEIATWLRET